jgi:hypothetical protein
MFVWMSRAERRAMVEAKYNVEKWDEQIAHNRLQREITENFIKSINALKARIAELEKKS